jgi:endonuclease V-like protein UPF0215 family
VAAARPHVIGIDDGPFTKGVDPDTPLVAVLMEGAGLVEAIAVERFPVDGAHVTGFLADWIARLRFRPSAQGLVFGGLTLAGLAVLDPDRLAAAVGLPVLVVNRRAPANELVIQALRAAGLEDRIAVLERAPHSVTLHDGLHVAFAGTDEVGARRLLAATTGKSALPEPLRVAHLVAAALARGESRGRV